MAVNSKTWQRFPIADRDQSFNADHAIKRIAQAAAGSVETFNMAFLWRGDQLPPNNKNSYRLPIADVINGKFTLIPHAVFTAAAILSGAHGGLEGVVGEQEKAQLRDVVTRIYTKLRDLYSDPRLIPPWERNDVPPNERPNRQIATTAAGTLNTRLLDMELAQPRATWAGMDAYNNMWKWSEGDYRKYRQGFVWWQGQKPERRNAYVNPLADVEEGRLVLVPNAVRQLDQLMREQPALLEIPDSVMPQLETLVAALMQRIEEQEVPVTEQDVPLRPPAHWFDDPQLQGPTPLSITADGRVRGHLALWDVCHFAIRDKCRLAPRSHSGYKFFTTGEVLTADGGMRRVGRITQGTGHAHLTLGYVPAADHYDNTGHASAIVAAGEDSHGIWVAGSLVPGLSERQVAELRRSPLSGDWRPTPQGLELVAALAVNSPGFPVVGFTASGEVQSLVAAGMVLPEEDVAALAAQQVVQDEPRTSADEQLAARLARFQEKADNLSAVALRRRYAAVLNNGGQ